jgi:hypothetical protein
MAVVIPVKTGDLNQQDDPSPIETLVVRITETAWTVPQFYRGRMSASESSETFPHEASS